MSAAPAIHIAPLVEEGLVRAVEQGGGRVTDDPSSADGVLWVLPFDPESLGKLLTESPARWVQLPFAGIESFFEAGVIDPGRTWTCAKGIYGHACAEHALALMLAAARRIHTHARDRRWVPPGPGSPERRLAGTRVLIFGSGGIGGALVSMLAPLKARVIAVNRSGRPVEGAESTHRSDELPDLLPDVDFVVVTAALTPETRGLFDAAMLARMKEGSWLVNVARGGLVVTDDLVEALRHGRLGGAALDVTDPEPLPEDHPLWKLDNAIITPHIANTWDMALPELRDLVRRNTAHFAKGEPMEGLVDPVLGY